MWIDGNHWKHLEKLSTSVNTWMLVSLKPSLHLGFPPHGIAYVLPVIQKILTKEPHFIYESLEWPQEQALLAWSWCLSSLLAESSVGPLGNPAPRPGDGCSISSLNNSDSWTLQKTCIVPSGSLPPERQSLSKKSFCANHSRSISHVCPFLAKTAPGICVIFIAYPCTLIHPDRVNLQLYLIFLQRWIKTELFFWPREMALDEIFILFFYFIDNLNVPDTSGQAGFWPSEGSDQ